MTKIKNCQTCGQKFEMARTDQGDGTCVFCHENLDNKKSNYGKPKWDYVRELQAMTDEKLKEATQQMIWLSAYASNNYKSDYHWQCDQCYDECQRRNKPEIYRQAHKLATQ